MRSYTLLQHIYVFLLQFPESFDVEKNFPPKTFSPTFFSEVYCGCPFGTFYEMFDSKWKAPRILLSLASNYLF